MGMQKTVLMFGVVLLLAGPMPAQEPMDFTIGNDVGAQIQTREQARSWMEKVADGAAKARVTAFEPYVKWMLLEPEQGKWDFSYYDMQLDIYRERGLRWVPFLIAGPAYATPMWFKESDESVFAKCLAHEEETRTQSIWNPQLRPHIDGLVRAFAEHYDANEIQMLLLGISGDFGETIYTAGGNEWTYKFDGEYHVHQGFWCGDDHAVADFQQWLQKKYGDIETLNRVWKTEHKEFAILKPFVPTRDVSERANVDMGTWYRESMTDFAEFWLQTVRRYMPNVTLTLCTGGHTVLRLGADFSSQALMAKKYNAGIRITNEASDYEQNVLFTRWVGTVCRRLGTYFGYEPAGHVDMRGIVARVYNAVASGADELFVYDNPPTGARGTVYEVYRDLLTQRNPAVDVAIFHCKTSQSSGLWRELMERNFGRVNRPVRDFADYDILDESTIAKGWLNDYKVLFWLAGRMTEESTLEAMEAWARKGGYLVIGFGNPCTVEGEYWKERLARIDTVRFLLNASIGQLQASVEDAPRGLFYDGVRDNLYHTRFEDGSRLILNYGSEPKMVEGQVLESNRILEVPAPRTKD